MERVSTRAACACSVFNARRTLLPGLFRTSLAFLILTGGLAAGAAGQTAPPPRPLIVDPNVNMVRGLGNIVSVGPPLTRDPATGDPFLQRQNEPSIAISTRNSCLMRLICAVSGGRTRGRV
jgi:hypothetical protein